MYVYVVKVPNGKHSSITDVVNVYTTLVAAEKYRTDYQRVFHGLLPKEEKPRVEIIRTVLIGGHRLEERK